MIALYYREKWNKEWLNTVVLSGPKPLVFWQKFGSDKDWVCQLLIEHINNKSSNTQEEMEYALCWRQSPVVLFPLKEKKRKKKDREKNPKTPSTWDLLSSLPPLQPCCSSIWGIRAGPHATTPGFCFSTSPSQLFHLCPLSTPCPPGFCLPSSPPNPSTSTPFNSLPLTPYLKPILTVIPKGVRAMLFGHWESTFSSVPRGKTILPLSSQGGPP
jgi:hypothetical protein